MREGYCESKQGHHALKDLPFAGDEDFLLIRRMSCVKWRLHPYHFAAAGADCDVDATAAVDHERAWPDIKIAHKYASAQNW